MDRNKLLALAAIVIILIIAIFYYFWGIFFNKGTLVLNGAPPFSISFDNKSVDCLEAVCRVDVPTGDLSYVISKQGYYEKSGLINVARGAEIELQVNLDFVPSVLETQEYKVFNLPVGYSKFKDRLSDITLFHEFDSDHELKRLPKKINDIIFSPSGLLAVYFGEYPTYYETQGYFSWVINGFEDAKNVAWSSDEKTLYSISFDEDSGKTALKKINIEPKGEAESLIYFTRDIINYQLSVSPEENYVLIADKTFDPQVLYLVDLNEQSRKNIFEGQNIKLAQWADDESLFVFQGVHADEDLEALWMFDPIAGDLVKLPFEGKIEALDISNGSMYFISSQPYNLLSTSSPYMIEFTQQEGSDLPEVIDISIFDEQVEESHSLSLFELNFTNLQFYRVQDLFSNLDSLPDKLEVSEDDSIIRILKDDQYFDIKVN